MGVTDLMGAKKFTEILNVRADTLTQNRRMYSREVLEKAIKKISTEDRCFLIEISHHPWNSHLTPLSSAVGVGVCTGISLLESGEIQVELEIFGPNLLICMKGGSVEFSFNGTGKSYSRKDKVGFEYTLIKELTIHALSVAPQKGPPEETVERAIEFPMMHDTMDTLREALALGPEVSEEDLEMAEGTVMDLVCAPQLPSSQKSIRKFLKQVGPAMAEGSPDGDCALVLAVMAAYLMDEVQTWLTSHREKRAVISRLEGEVDTWKQHYLGAHQGLCTMVTRDGDDGKIIDKHLEDDACDICKEHWKDLR